jgi:hypothetical protein
MSAIPCAISGFQLSLFGNFGIFGNLFRGCRSFFEHSLQTVALDDFDAWATQRFPLGHPDFSTGPPKILLGPPRGRFLCQLRSAVY